MRRNLSDSFDEELPKPKVISVNDTDGWKNFCQKKLTLYDLVFVFLLLGIAEIIFRLLWAPTPISFLFPVCIFAMFLNITDRPVVFFERWYLLLPFLLFMMLLCILLIFKPSPEADRIWLLCYLVAYMTEALVCMIPVIVGIQKYIFYEYDSQNLFFIQFLSFAQLIGALLLFVIISSDKQILFFANGANENLHPAWSISLTLIVAVLASLQYLVFTKRPEKNSYPLTVRINNCNKMIIYLFNDQKIYLNPELTFNMLTVVSRIDKSDLEFFFNEYIGKSFQYFVAEYRVAHAINLITKKGDLYTLEAIGFESGFRCRASFNKYFKLITGMLPSQYMRMKTA